MGSPGRAKTVASRPPRARLLAARNTAKALLLLALLAAALGVLGWALGGPRPAAVGVFVGTMLVATLGLYGGRIVIGMVGARELLPSASPALASEVERLARAAGVGPIRIAVVDDGHPRLLVTGRGRRSTLIVTTGLLSLAPPSELDGLIAHELAHVRHRDVLLQTVVCVLAAWLLELSRIGGFLQRVLLFVLAPLAASLVHLAISPRREYAADAAAAVICGDPIAVATGLTRLDRAQHLVDFAANPATGLLYPIDPFEPVGIAAMLQTHPPLDQRLRRLEALATPQTDTPEAASAPQQE